MQHIAYLPEETMGRRGKNFSAIELELLWRRWKGGESSLQNRCGTRLVEVGDLASDSATWRAGDATTAARGAGPESPRSRGDFARRGNCLLYTSPSPRDGLLS